MEDSKNETNEQKDTTVGLLENIEEKEENNTKIKSEILERTGIDFEEEKTMESKNGNHKLLIILTIIFILMCVFSVIFALINLGNDKIIKGVLIDKVDVSNMTKEQAKKILEEYYLQRAENEIILTHGEFESTTTYTALEVKYKTDEAIEKAYIYGRQKNLIKDNYDILKSLIKGKEIDINVEIDKEMLNQISNNINNSIEGAITQPSYYIEEDKLIITSGKIGLKVDENELSQKIYEYVRQGLQAQTIEIPFITAEPDKIDIEKIHDEIYKEVKDAYYTQEPFTIYPEVEGIDFNIEDAQVIIAEEKEQYEIPLIVTKPTKTTRDIGTEASPDLLATFSTKYQASNKNRTTNLILAANKINGTVLLPGEEFSYNKTVGERTPQAGFKNAATFSGGKVVDGIGGGICQISTTLYDAVVMADLEITQRRNHQFVTSYVGGGKDATVVWGSQDFKFKNTRKYPVRITATVQGGIATVQVWGIREEVEYDITIETKKTATINYTTQYIQTSELPAGQQKVIQAGNNGSKYEAYKVKRLNGEVVSKTLLSKDTYNAMKKIVHVGTGQ